MELPLIIFKQTIIMALYMAAGYFLFKLKKISIDGSKSLASVLIWLVIPMMIIKSFCVPYSAARLTDFALSSLLGAISLAISIAIARLIFKKHPIDMFSCSFSNAGFIGIPLIKASLGDEAVFFLVGMISMLNILQYTYGVSVMCDKKSKSSLKSIFLNPIILGTVIGFFVFILGLGDKIPEVLYSGIDAISALNAPLAMLVLGVYLAQCSFKELFNLPRLYVMSAVRLLLIPIVITLVFLPIPIDSGIKFAIIIASAAPAGSNVAVYAQLYDADYKYACKTVALTSIFSIATMPLVVMLAQYIGS